MSDLENGLRAALKITLAILLAVTFGPWLVMLAVAWLLEPRTGSWGAWPHIVGAVWASTVLGLAAYGWFRR